MKDSNLVFGFWMCGILASIAFGVAFGLLLSVGIGFLIGGISIVTLIPLSLQFTQYLRNK